MASMSRTTRPRRRSRRISRRWIGCSTSCTPRRSIRCLIVLQGLDAGGKDGVVRHVITGMNPAACRVVGFKQPTAEELEHDFLWRVHPHAPQKGEVAIFNRSHYEDVLVVRVHRPRAREDLVETLRPDQPVRAAAGSGKQHDHLEVLPCTSRRKSSWPDSSSGWTTRCANGRSATPTTRSASIGTTTSRRSRMRCARPARRGPRGSSFRRTTSGFAIWPSRRSSAGRWRRWT